VLVVVVVVHAEATRPVLVVLAVEVLAVQVEAPRLQP
jgi:hypothetical protein